MLSRDISLTELTGGLYHACHISAAQSVDVLKIAKERGINYSAEVTPHHLTITEDFILGPDDQNRKQISENAYNTFAKVFPPLRTKSDIQSLIEGINSDLISIIATDHAPHGYEDKMTTLNQAAFGISNFETTLGSVLQLFYSKDIKLEKLLKCLTSNPAEFLGKKLGKLTKGYPADIVIIDLKKEWEVDISDFVSLGKNSPLQGTNFKGKILQTLVDGEVVYSDDKGHNG
jgi:dihydroorotase